MIDFRYHVVSIVAVFMALAIGIILGSGPLREPITQGLRSQTDQLVTDKAGLRDQIRSLNSQLSYAQSFAGAVDSELVAHRLDDQRVALVTLPGTSGRLTTSVRSVLTGAGAVISGQVELTAAFLDPEKIDIMDELAARLAPDRVTAVVSDDPYARVASVLGSALLTPEVTLADLEPEPAAAALVTGLAQAGFLDVSGDPVRRATLVVVIAPDAPNPVGDPDLAVMSALVTVVSGLDRRAGGSVVAGGPGSAAKGGLLAAVRGSSTASQRVSSVDTADTAAGQVATVYALVEQNRGGVGHYGMQDGASAVIADISGPVLP